MRVWCGSRSVWGRADAALGRLFSSSEAAVPSAVKQDVSVLFPVVRRAVPRLERHSQPRQKQYSSLTVFTVPVLDDAYSFILYDHHSKEGAVIDAGEPELVLKTCEK